MATQAKAKPIASKPNADRDCDRCGSVSFVEVNGNANCHYCGNTVALCQDCAEELASSLVRALNLVGA